MTDTYKCTETASQNSKIETLVQVYTMFMLHLHCLRESGNVTSYAAETCFMRGKQQVQELQELIQVMPEKQKIDLWDFWDAAQKFINSCFQNILAEVSKMQQDKHIVVEMHPQEPVKSQLHETSGPDGTPDLDIPSVNCKVETLSVPETYTEITEYHNEGYEEITGSVVDSGGTSMIIKREDGSVMWETETVQAAEAISETDHTSKETDHFSEETDHITEETVHISEEADYISEEADYISEETDHISNEVVKERTAQNDVADMSSMSSNLHKSMNSSASTSNILKEDIKSSDPQNIVHVQVEKVNGIKQNIEIDESLPIDENDPVIILQDEDVFNEYIKAEENSNSNKSMEAWERLEHNTEQQNVKKSKKGRPKRKEYSEMCIPVTKDDGTTVFQCEMCGVQMTHYPNLKVHLRSHTGQRPFRCSKCPKTFTTKGNMKEHEATHDTNRPQYECERCGKLFKQLKCLKIHARIHTGERPYKCAVCEKSFSQPGILQSHLLIHSDQRNHLCISCGKCFRLKSQLELHKKRHENRRDFKCDLCSFETITRSDLLRHMAVHTSEKKFSCTVCQKKFTRAQYLSEHMNIHEGKTPYHCTDCDASFSLATKLYSHKRKHRREMAEQLLREAQSQNIETQSDATLEALQTNQSVSLKIEDRSVEIKSVKLPETAARGFVRYTENQSSLNGIQIENSLQIEKELLVISHPGSSVQTPPVMDGVPQLTENLWAGDEQYVELVIGQDISVEDLNSLISSKVISFRQSEGSLIETTDVPISMQE